MRSDSALEGYFCEASTWDTDRICMAERSLRIAWRVAFAAIFVTVCFVVVLLLLMPLKRVEPFVIRVDSTTGVVDVVPIYTGQSNADETLTRYLLSHYVSVCERFNFATAESDYQECGAFHSVRRNQEWLQLWTKSNPLSPLNVYKDGSTVRVQVSAISFLKRASGVSDLAQIRYTQAHRQSGTSIEQLSHWIATIQYAYTKPSQDARLRSLNPLGFKVVEFHAEPEIQAGATPSRDKSPSESDRTSSP